MDTETTALPEPQQVAPAQEPSPSEAKPSEQAPEAPQAEEKNTRPEDPEKLVKKIGRQRAVIGDYERKHKAMEERIKELEALTKPQSDDRPKPEDFDDHDAYTDAVADWKVAQKEKAKAEETSKPSPEDLQKNALEMAQRQIAFEAAESELRKADPAYDANAAVVNDFLKLADKNDKRFAAFSTNLLKADNPPAVINYLGANPKEILALFQAPTAEDVEDILESITTKLAAPKPKPADLPEPPNPITKTASQKTEDGMSGRDLRKKYRVL